ncbi:bifunctional homocysteine S-methyltransferase/methylenetetrahydrofolate reductase [Desulfuromonas versatilis]|uniref:Bifunctional homocysteine S-methyltransferase/methylenetetrahydrofolate reductase n=1 Tax=Desulfuromonas versatilis TaxID=2802975 RepID=A0ABM8HP31_9BACT|nr:bifunctional homocysteine S-methyltransferase/methylenetetrahydrofolate reductase [Desulfuromonas versatilis]BCR03362.1 bifunctional homocysteine S-methyltransferase/methylenetetrahydrofolate reductase [Desulfuromonas versatilis]
MTQSAHRGPRFLDRLAEQVIIGDGAMGTLLYSRGTPLDVNFEHLNLVKPELIREVHGEYLAAGAALVETNTFGANALNLGAVGLEGKVRAINEAGARLARQAAGPGRFVAGAVGPLIRPRGEAAEVPRSQRRAVFHEQMEALAEGGVDLFMLETFSSLEDLELVLDVARELGLPAVAQMAYLEGGRTREGVSAEIGARRLTEAGASVLGANCGSGPRELIQVLERMGAVSPLPLSAFPNSGFPQYLDGRYIYLATPEYFAAKGAEMVAAGAALVGGCCGTTPEHIRALAEALKGMRPAARKLHPVRGLTAVAEPVAAPAGVRPTFLDGWGKRPVVTVELDPPRGVDCEKVLAGARELAAAGVDAISLAENPLARIRMGNLALARVIQEQTGLEVIAHVTCRDRNLIGLHSELMGAHLLGLRNILAVTGDPVSVGGESGATSVFDLNSVGLLELLSALNAGKSLLGAELGGRTQFLLGAAFNPNLPSMTGQLNRLRKKIAAGARFVQTQPIYSERILQQLIEQTDPLEIPVLVGVLPLVSERNAEFLHNEVPGITLPEEVRRRMKGKSGEEGVREGMAIARELVEAGRGKVGGWYLMPPFGKVGLARELVEFIRGAAP